MEIDICLAMVTYFYRYLTRSIDKHLILVQLFQECCTGTCLSANVFGKGISVMDLKQLEYFITIAQLMNFTKAATVHHLSQPAISHRITDLEAELGVKLFIRSKSRISLTSAGEAFYKYAIEMVETANVAKGCVNRIAMGQDGHLRISAVPTCSRTLTELLTEFGKRYPNIDVQVDFSTGKEQLAAIKNKNEYDFYFSFLSLIQSCENLVFLETETDRFGIFLAKRHADKIKPGDYTRLNELKFATEVRAVGPFLVDRILSICTAHGIDTSRAIGCRDCMSVFLFVNSEMAFTVFPLGMMDYVSDERIVAFPIDGKEAEVVSAVGWNALNNNNSADLFLKLLMEKYKHRMT